MAIRAAYLSFAFSAPCVARAAEGFGETGYDSVSPYAVVSDSIDGRGYEAIESLSDERPADAKPAAGEPAGTAAAAGTRAAAIPGPAARIDSTAGEAATADAAGSGPGNPLQAAIPLPEVRIASPRRLPAHRPNGSDQRALAAAQLERGVSAFGDPARFVRYLPGAGRGNDWGTELIVRGGSPDQTGFLVDGIPLSRTSHYEGLRGEHGGVGILNLAFADSLRFHAGTFPARFPDRLSGMVEVEYRDGDTAARHESLVTDVSGAGGSAEGPLPGGRGSYAAAARYSAMDLLIRSGVVEAYGVPEYFNGQARVTVPVGGAALRARFIGAREEWSNDIGASRLDLDGHSLVASLSLESEHGDDRARAEARYEERAHALAFASWREAPGSGRDAMSRLESGLERRWGAALERSAAAGGGWVLGAGVTAQAALGRYRTRYGDQATYLAALDTVIQFSQDIGAGRKLLANGAAYAEGTLTAGKAELYVGYRHLYEQASREHAPGPRFAAAFRPAPGHRLRAAFGLHSQPHEFADLAQRPDRGRARLPYMAQADAGWTWAFLPGCLASLDLFAKEGYRLSRQAISPVGEAYAYAFQDTGRTRAHGLEAALRAPRNGRWDVSIGYGFLRYRERGPDGRWGPGPFSLPHSLNLAGGLAVAQGLWLSGRFSAGSGSPYTPFDSAASMSAGTGVYDAGQAYARSGPAYYRLDARLDWERPLRGARVGVFAEVENLLDRRNESGRQWNPVDGRESPIDGMGRLPTAGFSVRF